MYKLIKLLKSGISIESDIPDFKVKFKFMIKY